MADQLSSADFGFDDHEPLLTRVPDAVRPFLGQQQAAVTDSLLRDSDEKAFFSDKMRELEGIIAAMPETYGTDGMPDETRPVSLRYFGPGGQQWFIIEKDVGDPETDGPGFPRQDQVFGLADLGMGSPEFGYISIPEITRAGAELDYHFAPTTLLEVKRQYYPELIKSTELPDVSHDVPSRDRALAIYQEFYDTLPERAEAVIQKTIEKAEKLGPADFLGYEKMMREYQKDIDETFGIIREGEYRGSSRPEVELMQALPGESIYNIPEVKARFAQSLQVQDRIGETRRQLETQFMDRLKEHGKALLDAGWLQDPKGIYLACLWKSGAAVRPDSEMVNKFLTAVKNKDLSVMVSWIGANSQNPGSQEAFSRLTGVQLGKTQKERVAQLAEWAGKEQVEELKNRQEQKAKIREEKRKVEGLANAWENLKDLRVNMSDGRIVNGQEYIAEKVGKGQDHVVARREGAVYQYYLLNRDTSDISGVRKPTFTRYAKAVLAMDQQGDVRNAMHLAGLGDRLPEPQKAAPSVDTAPSDPGQQEASKADLDHLFGKEDPSQHFQQAVKQPESRAPEAGQTQPQMTNFAKTLLGRDPSDDVPANLDPQMGRKGPEALGKLLKEVGGETLMVSGKQGERATTIREYLDGGIRRGMTATQDRGDSVFWYNPDDTKYAKTITDPRIIGVLREAARVHPNLGEAVRMAAPQIQNPGKGRGHGHGHGQGVE
ncbi:DUF2958 domain-containing protein [Acidithiobacillus caldus]|uniref:Uncharacterized protein n=1 Tax=Acidithiobacillus caldus (strain SM-1) TaxID=990288 RepID=F9ZNU7_ACICS|nr:DUF2958 domain-containing protein [Acidithiobacillus caldus]AEK57927.1 domain of unknown function DUF1738 [Acidithiobacillus caldus SM-1]AUW32592.1 DUF2958 domain-containing protein [Acidithiobacillus caldus]QER44698.1 hypothetical protein F0726_01629 [Acidithiobacillus caldus]